MNRIVWDYLDRKRGHDYRRDMRDDYRDGYRKRNSINDYRRSRARDYDDRYIYDVGDYSDEPDALIKLSKNDIYEWSHKMRNADGSKGKQYDLQQIMPIAEHLGINFKDFDEKELCIATNMFYSDYCQVLTKYIPHDAMLTACVELAKAFLEDEDGPIGSEKLALYYHCIVNNEEV